jgi:D-alanyl-D-alanine carboxypeptidase
MIDRRIRPILLALAVIGVSVLASAPVTLASTTAPPQCAYDAIPAKNAAYRDWRITLLDPIYEVSKAYVPPGLVPTADAGVKGAKIRKVVIPDLEALANAARTAGAGVRVVSGYRSWSYEKYLYDREVAKWGVKLGSKRVARPGHSEHQLGTALDFGSAGTTKLPWQYTDWATTTAGAWMKHNAWKFGFIMSYPKGKSPSITCYVYEAWHYRYVGRDEAAKVHASGLTLREYLWKHYAS